MPPLNTTFSAGKILFHENDRSREMYLINKGRVSVYRKERGGRIDICELGPGSIVGEMSLLDNRNRSATVEALETTEVTVVTPETFKKKAYAVPDWFMGIIKILCTRLRDVDRRLKTSYDEYCTANIAFLLAMMLRQKNINRQGSPNETTGMDLKRAKEEVLDILGLSREKINTSFKELQRDAILRVENNRIMVKDVCALELYSDIKSGEIEYEPDIAMPDSFPEKGIALLKRIYCIRKGELTRGPAEQPLTLSEDATALWNAEGVEQAFESARMARVRDKKEKEGLTLLVNGRRIAGGLVSFFFNGQTF